MEVTLKKYNKSFSTRPLAHRVFDLFVDNNHGEITIDFDGVEDVTPSFCHEMMSIFIEHKIRMRIINANENIKLQIRKARAAFTVSEQN